MTGGALGKLIASTPNVELIAMAASLLVDDARLAAISSVDALAVSTITTLAGSGCASSSPMLTRA